ncbi:hypothetical protein M413DRAFT_30592 [Hebeloma cylindrosporum]|uniref:Uncharacterized protein n=1 Tax=Hebeloma cylindrosporum TaxID=76867 RepID=A0A0C3C0Z3_HEBCY|nr:hypothetical protein M413DRAFT_30592 [Hebeloma cylindrosporum h7]
MSESSKFGGSEELPDSTSQPSHSADAASAPKDAEDGEEDNPAESDDDDGDLEDLFGDDEYKVERAFRDSGLEAGSEPKASSQESPMPKLDKGKGKAIEEPENIVHEYIKETIPPLLDKGKAKENDASDNRDPGQFSGVSSFPPQSSLSNFMDGSQQSSDPMSIDDTAAQSCQRGSSFPLPAESHSYGDSAMADGQADGEPMLIDLFDDAFSIFNDGSSFPLLPSSSTPEHLVKAVPMSVDEVEPNSNVDISQWTTWDVEMHQHAQETRDQEMLFNGAVNDVKTHVLEASLVANLRSNVSHLTLDDPLLPDEDLKLFMPNVDTDHVMGVPSPEEAEKASYIDEIMAEFGPGFVHVSETKDIMMDLVCDLLDFSDEAFIPMEDIKASPFGENGLFSDGGAFMFTTDFDLAPDPMVVDTVLASPEFLRSLLNLNLEVPPELTPRKPTRKVVRKSTRTRAGGRNEIKVPGVDGRPSQIGPSRQVVKNIRHTPYEKPVIALISRPSTAPMDVDDIAVSSVPTPSV